MPTLLLDSTSLAEVQDVFGAKYASTRVESTSPNARTRLVQSRIGSLVVDDLCFDYEFTYQCEPMTKLGLFLVHSGTVQQGDTGSAGIFTAGHPGVSAPHEGRGFNGYVAKAHCTLMLVDRNVLNRVAAGPPARGHSRVVITAEKPVSAVAGRHMANAIRYVRDTAIRGDAPENRLLGSVIEQNLAATMLTVFPNTALLEPTIEDRRDSRPVLLRRAESFIDDNAQRDIALTDIAEAVHISPRALQYMFRKHRDCAPMDYVRRVRLGHAHRELLSAHRTQTTVCEIASRWGFGHSGRFAVYYRQTYGQSPHVTLRKSR